MARARETWKDDQASLDASKLVFIDETGTNTKMVRTRGRCHRSRRLIGKAPWGHWKTTTFVAGLRHNRISAPFVLEGAMNGQSFLTYLETILVPSLSASDIVVTDNLPAHKVVAKADRSRQRDTDLSSTLFSRLQPDRDGLR